MRLLVAIPHFFAEKSVTGAAAGAFNSRADRRAERVAALTRCLEALGALFGPRHLELSHTTRTVGGQVIIHPRESVLEVLIAIHRDHHVLADIALPPFARAVPCDRVKPMFLGFACHDLLLERAGAHDHYAYLEDDLVIHDADFMAKQRWFAEQFGPAAMLQPHRFEAGPQGLRIYVDGDLPPKTRTPPMPVAADALEARHLGRALRFERRNNPMSGCFFLSAAQIDHWAASPQRHDRDLGFIGTLESAQILPLMKQFPIYKPAMTDARFLEIEHIDARLSKLPSPAGIIRKIMADIAASDPTS